MISTSDSIPKEGANAPDLVIRFYFYFRSLQETAKIFHSSVVKYFCAWYNTIADSCSKPQKSAIGGALYGN